jgi:hypothetical protein
MDRYETPLLFISNRHQSDDMFVCCGAGRFAAYQRFAVESDKYNNVAKRIPKLNKELRNISAPAIVFCCCLNCDFWGLIVDAVVLSF